MKRRRGLVLLAPVLAILLALALAGCAEDNSVSAEEPISVDVFFDFTVNGQPLLLNQMIYDNPAGRKYSVKTLRFVLADIRIHSEQGNDVKLRDMHYFDMADPSTQTIHFEGGVPHADWSSVTFIFGLDETRNVRDKYRSMTRFQQDMAWPTGLGADLGYHYMQLEGNYLVYPDSLQTAGYTTHTGPRQLDTDPVPYHFYFNVDLPVTPTHVHEGGKGEVTIHVELNGWYTDHTPADGNDTEYDFTDYPAMIMGNLEAQAKLQTNGPFCFSASMESLGGHH